jgi:hypothetical protein
MLGYYTDPVYPGETMPKNPVVDAIQLAGLPPAPAKPFHTPSHNMAGITLPPMRRQPLPLRDPELQRQREQIRAEEDAEVFRRLDAIAEGGFGPGTRVSPGLIPGTVNIQAPMQVSRIYPRLGSNEWLIEAAQQQMDAEIFRDIEAAQQALVTPIREVGRELPVEYIPGRGTQGVMTLENVRVELEALRRVFAETPGVGVFNPRGVTRLELFRDRIRGQPTEEVMRGILEGQHTAVSMGTRIEDDAIGRIRNWPEAIDGPTPDWVVAPADPSAIVPVNFPSESFRPERVTMPEFELASNPMVSIRDVATRRFDIVDRDYVPGRAIGERFHQERAVQEEPHTNVPYDGPRPTWWEKIVGAELIGS